MDSDLILKRLKEQGKITDEDIENIDKVTDEDIRSLAVAMHSMICDSKKHTTLEEFTLGIVGCGFYAEEQVDEHWGLPCHSKWFSLAELFSQQFPDYKEDPYKLVAVCTAINFMQDINVRDLVMSILTVLGVAQWEEKD